MALIWIVAIILLALAFAAFYLSRSSKEMPKNWRQFKSELLWQYLGIRGLIEDFMLRRNNRISEYPWLEPFFGTHTIMVTTFWIFFFHLFTELEKQPGRIVVITGGNRGIGLQIVKQLLNNDMTVIMGKYLSKLSKHPKICVIKTCGNENEAMPCRPERTWHSENLLRMLRRAEKPVNMGYNTKFIFLVYDKFRFEYRRADRLKNHILDNQYC